MSYDGDGDAHESRRNTTLAIGVAVAAVTMVGLLYWLFSSMTGPALAVSPTAATTSATTSADAAAPAASQTSDAAPPTIASWTPTTTFSLPPPEQPTVTSPVEGQTAVPPSAPATTQAPPPPPPPAGPTISNVDLKCSKSDGKRVTARLIFDVSAKVDITLSAGGQVDRKSGGPGNVSMTTTGRGPEICFAKIADKTFGPIPAS